MKFTVVKSLLDGTIKAVPNHGRWVAETGRRRSYALQADAEAYEAGYAAGCVSQPDAPDAGPVRGAFLQGVWDREEDDVSKAEAADAADPARDDKAWERLTAAIDRAYGGEGHLDVER